MLTRSGQPKPACMNALLQRLSTVCHDESQELLVNVVVNMYSTRGALKMCSHKPQASEVPVNLTSHVTTYNGCIFR